MDPSPVQGNLGLLVDVTGIHSLFWKIGSAVFFYHKSSMCSFPKLQHHRNSKGCGRCFPWAVPLPRPCPAPVSAGWVADPATPACCVNEATHSCVAGRRCRSPRTPEAAT